MQPHFDVVAILPNANFGPVVYGSPRSTIGWIYGILKGDGTPTKYVPPR